MKIKKVVKIEKEIEITEFICDNCVKEVDALAACCNRHCEKEICASCWVTEYDVGDYPDYYCKSCYSNYKKYLKQKVILENEYDDKLDKLYDEIMGGVGEEN